MVVPIPAIRGTGASRYVWVVQEGRAVRRPVTTGATDVSRGVVAIVTGLQAGEQVVVAPGEFEEGATVRVTADAGGN